MKILIVFLAFIVVFSSFMVFMTDSSNYLDLQRYLKALAEECAGGGALMRDSSKEGYVINAVDASSYKEFIVQKNKENIAPLSNGVVTVEISKISDTAIKAEAKWTANNGYKLFRLSLGFNPETVFQCSMYELKKID